MNNLKLNLPTHWNQSKKKRIFLGLNWFRNCHFRGLSKCKKEVHEIVSKALSSQTPTNPYVGRYKITSTLYFENKACDLDNSVLLVKYLNDSLQILGIVNNDSVDSCIEVRLLVGGRAKKGEGHCDFVIEFLD